MARVRPVLATWAAQPQEVVGIDWSHPRTDRLCFFMPGGDALGMRDLVRNQLLTLTGLSTQILTSEGPTRLFGTSSYADFTAPPEIGATTPFTVAWSQEARSTSAYSAILNVNFGSGTNCFAVYQSSAVAAYYFTAGPRGGGSTAHSWSVALGAVTNNRLDRFVLRAAAGSQSVTGSDWSLFRNGQLVSRGTSTTFSAFTGAAARIGARETGADPWEGAILDMRLWARVLSDDEAARESQVQPAAELYEPRRIWVPVGAAGGAVDVTPANALHAHAADVVALTSSTLLAPADALHAHAADSVALTLQVYLAVAEALHAHAAEEPVTTETAAGTVTPADAMHGHSADTVALTLLVYLVVADALHAHAVDAPAVSLPSSYTTLELIYRILANRQELNPADGTFTIYDDDGTTVLLSAQAWADADGTVPYSGNTLARIDRLV